MTSPFFVALYIVVYLALNLILNYGNKLLLQHFHFPLFMILVGTLFYMPLSALLIRVARVASFPSRKQALDALPLVLLIGSVHAIGTGAQNWSLSSSMSVGLNQVVKASTPAVTLVCSFLLQGSRYHWSLVLTTLAVVMGSALTVYASAEASVLGVSLSVVSSLFGGLEGVLTAMLMERHSLHPAQASFLIALPAAGTLLVPFFLLEFTPHFIATMSERGLALSLYILLLSMAAAAYSYTHYLVIASTSAHYCNLVGSFKLALIVSVSFFVVAPTAQHLTALNAAGIAVTLSSFVAYTVLRSYYPEWKKGDATDQKELLEEKTAEGKA